MELQRINNDKRNIGAEEDKEQTVPNELSHNNEPSHNNELRRQNKRRCKKQLKIIIDIALFLLFASLNLVEGLEIHQNNLCTDGIQFN